MDADHPIADVPDQDACNHFFVHSSNLLCVADFDGYFKQLNPKWERVLGFSGKELRAAPLQSFVHPEDRATVMAAMSALQRPRSSSRGGAGTAAKTDHFGCSSGR